MPMWAIILTVVFSGVVMIISVAGFLRSFRFATKDDLDELKENIKKDIGRLEIEIRNINQRIDRHLEGHP